MTHHNQRDEVPEENLYAAPDDADQAVTRRNRVIGVVGRPNMFMSKASLRIITVLLGAGIFASTLVILLYPVDLNYGFVSKLIGAFWGFLFFLPACIWAAIADFKNTLGKFILAALAITLCTSL